MRTILLTLLLCASAHAEIISIVRTGDWSDQGKIPPLMRVGETYVHNMYFGEFEHSWSIPGIDVDDIGQSFLLDETTAESYDADWDELMERFEDVGVLMVYQEFVLRNSVNKHAQRLNVTPPTELISVGLEYNLIAQISETAFRVQATITYTLDTTVPEPNLFCLLLGAFPLLTRRLVHV